MEKDHACQRTCIVWQLVCNESLPRIKVEHEMNPIQLRIPHLVALTLFELYLIRIPRPSVVTPPMSTSRSCHSYLRVGAVQGHRDEVAKPASEEGFAPPAVPWRHPIRCHAATSTTSSNCCCRWNRVTSGWPDGIITQAATGSHSGSVLRRLGTINLSWHAVEFPAMMVHVGVGRAQACRNLHCRRRRETHHDGEKNGYHASTCRTDDTSRLPLRTSEPPEDAEFLQDGCRGR